MRIKTLITIFFLFSCRLFSQNILGEYTLLKWTSGGSDEWMKAVYSIDHVESKVCKIQLSGNDTVIDFDWDGQNTPNLSLLKKGNVAMNLKKSTFSIKNIKLINPEKFTYSYNSTTKESDTKTLEVRNFKIELFNNQYLTLYDLDYKDLSKRYYFKKKKVATARTPH